MLIVKTHVLTSLLKKKYMAEKYHSERGDIESDDTY